MATNYPLKSDSDLSIAAQERKKKLEALVTKKPGSVCSYTYRQKLKITAPKLQEPHQEPCLADQADEMRMKIAALSNPQADVVNPRR